MNKTWLLIGAAVFILVLALGRNPVEEAREDRAKRMAGKDPLVESIQEHNKSKNWSNMVRQRQHAPAGQPGAPSGVNNMPSYMMRDPSTHIGTTPPPMPPPAAQDPNSYYPPLQAPDRQQPGPRSDYEPRLPDGRLLAFSGDRVFVYNAQGQPVALRDGKYKIYGGRVDIVVKGGKHIVISN